MMTANRPQGFSMARTLADRRARQERLDAERQWGDVAVAKIKKCKFVEVCMNTQGEELARWKRLAETWPNRLIIARNALTQTYRIAMRRD